MGKKNRTKTLAEVATEPKSYNYATQANYAQQAAAYQPFGGNVVSLSELLGVMDQELAAERNAAKPVTKDSTPKVTTSRIRVQLSRPLTWAEKEAIETNHCDVHGRKIADTNDSNGFSFRVSPSREHIWAEAGFGSRLMYDLIAAILEQHFVNVYPKAVRTFREYNGE